MIYASKHSRRIAVIIAFLLIIALLFTGTYAWQSISQYALNQMIGRAVPAGGRLHDDFQVMGDNYGEKQWQKGVVANKDIYVENFESEYARDIFVRVKLYEYMEIGQGANLHPGDVGYPIREAISLIPAAKREDVTTWSPRLPGDNENSNLFREYWTWEMGGDKVYMPTFNKDPFSKESDVKGSAMDPQALSPGEVINATNPGGNAPYPDEAGGHDYFLTTQTKEAQEKYWHWALNNGNGGHALSSTNETHNARSTLGATIVKMADWNGSIGNYWVLDEDGWCYWAAPLTPQTATGLLLSGIILNKAPDLTWYYAIHVEAQMATVDEVNSAFYDDSAQTPTDEAKNLLDIITNAPVLP